MNAALTPEQRRAVEARNRDVLLEAGAGTGKTTVIVERLVAAVLEDEVPLSAICAFTFTEAAAGELRARVRGALEARAHHAAAAGDGAAAVELHRLARETEEAWISTIHGFCRRVVAAHPFDAGADPGFRVLDAAEARRLEARAAGEAIEELATGERHGAAGVELWAALGEARLGALVAGAHAELRSRSPAEPELPPAPAGDTAAFEELGARARAVQAATAEAKRAADRHAKLDRAVAIASEAQAGRGVDPDEVRSLEMDSTAAAFAIPEVESYRQAVRRAAACAAGEVHGEEYEALRALVRGFGEHYRRLKAERSGLDFEDLQALCVRVLEGPAGALYRERFRHVLVDELQDTNAVQARLIEALRGDETFLFCVGDEQQSIYGFRHADVEVFRRERERLRSDGRGEVMRLAGSFRSRPGVVSAVCELGSAILPSFQPLEVGLVQAEGPSAPQVELLVTEREGWRPGRDENGEAGGDEPALDLGVPPESPTQPERVAEARALAERLRGLVDEGLARPAEIVVLLRSFTHVDAYEDALERVGLSPHRVGGGGYWSGQQVEDVRRMLGSIANPLDDEALLGLLSSPAGGVSPDALWMLRQAAGPSTPLWHAVRWLVTGERPEEAEEQMAWLGRVPAPDAERLAIVHGTLEELRAEAPRLGLDALVERAVRAFDYDLALLSRPHGPRRLANVEKLARLAREIDLHEGLDLRGLLDELSARTREDREAVAGAGGEEAGGVRILTVHAAKGLEFGVVAVADLGRRLLAAPRPALRVAAAAGAPPGSQPSRVGIRLARLGRKGVPLFELDELTRLAEEAEEAEELRLAYVAATRAQRLLLLSGVQKIEALSEPPSEARGRPVMDRILRHLAPGGGPLPEHIPLPAPRPREGLEARFAEQSIRVLLNRPSPQRARELCDLGPPAAQEPGPGRNGGVDEPSPALLAPPPAPAAETPVALSASAIAAHRRCAYRFWAERVLGLGPLEPGQGADRRGADGPASGRLALGRVVHSLLEWSAGARWAEPDAERVRSQAAAEGLGADQAGRALEMVRGWLGSELLAELERGRARLRTEVPFVLPVAGTRVRGVIDLLVEAPGEEPLVIDYKTDEVDGDADEAAERYRTQRDIYALAVTEATGAEAVRTAWTFLGAGERAVAVQHRLGPLELDSARTTLEKEVGAIATGPFPVTDRPHRSLCFDCPARPRLCPYGPEATMRPDEAAADSPLGG